MMRPRVINPASAQALPPPVNEADVEWPPDPPAAGGSHPAEGAAATAEAVVNVDPKARIAGTITVAAAVKDKIQGGDTIFLVAREDDGTDKGGRIMGVKRFTAAELPIQFVLDQRDAMGPSVPLTGAVILSARVDKDGDAMTKSAGDVLGVSHVKVPASGVRVELSQITR